MKNIFILFIVLTLLSIDTKAQCPPLITDADGMGGAYHITLSSNVCASFPNGTPININGTNEYQVSACTNYGDPTGPYVLELNFNDGTPVVLADNAPVSFSFSSMNCSYDNAGNLITLPVELIAFKGTPSVSSNVLTWTTASEENNKGFEVERLNGNDWQNISFVAGNNKASTYEFMDKSPLSISYYRLKQVDNDGKFEYSKVISVVQSGKGKSFKIYPNPVSNVLTLETESAGDYQIINLLGQQVLTGKKASLGVESIDVSALPQGSYWLKTGSDIAKFIKQ